MFNFPLIRMVFNGAKHATVITLIEKVHIFQSLRLCYTGIWADNPHDIIPPGGDLLVKMSNVLP